MSADSGSRRDRDRLVVPITGIFILLLIQSLIIASAFLIPVTTAILGYFILNAPRRALARVGVPSPIAATIFTLVIGTVLTLGGLALSEPVTDFVADIPGLIDEVLVLLTGPGGPFEIFSRAAEATDKVLEESGADAPMRVRIVGNGGGLAASVALVAPGVAGQIIFAMCLLFFLVASGDLFIQKTIQVVDRFHDKKTTLATIRRIEARLGNYLGAITLINIGLGIVIGTAMWIWGIPSPWLVGGMATVLNFIPFVGAVVGAFVAGIIAFVAFVDPVAGIGVFFTYYVLTAFEGQLITPALVGQRLRLNVTMVFLSVAFFAWIWSVMGMVVAVPLLIVVKVVCDSVPRLRKVGLFLGDAEGFIEEDTSEAARTRKAP